MQIEGDNLTPVPTIGKNSIDATVELETMIMDAIDNYDGPFTYAILVGVLEVVKARYIAKCLVIE